jgi:hypothetical protein
MRPGMKIVEFQYNFTRSQISMPLSCFLPIDFMLRKKIENIVHDQYSRQQMGLE